MSEKPEKLVAENVSPHEDLQQYQTEKIPLFLILTYVILPIWGIYFMISYWNGSHGWTDRGAWHELQVAANTTRVVSPEEPQKPRPTVGGSLYKIADDR